MVADWKVRLLAERLEMAQRVTQLSNYVDEVIAGNVEKPADFPLHQIQLSSMITYYNTLCLRCDTELTEEEINEIVESAQPKQEDTEE